MVGLIAFVLWVAHVSQMMFVCGGRLEFRSACDGDLLFEKPKIGSPKGVTQSKMSLEKQSALRPLKSCNGALSVLSCESLMFVSWSIVRSLARIDGDPLSF